MTTPSTLTERYVQEVVKRIPPDQREDVARELHATITDTIEAGGGNDPEAAERETLNQMGDPIRLAARYADRPLALIGPELYPAYIRLLVMLLSVVLPIVAAVIVAIDIIDEQNIGSAIGAGIGAILTVGAQIFAWLTVVFAVIERVKHRDGTIGTADTWTTDQLPEPRQKHDKRSTAAGASAAWHAALIGLIVWQHFAGPFTEDGTELLNPDLWSGWIWPVLAGLAAIAVLELIRVVNRGWNMALAGGHAAAQALFTLPLAWVLYQEDFFSQRFLSEVTVYDGFYTVAALGVLLVGVWESVKVFREARR